MTPKVGEKRALELECACDGYVDTALPTPLPAPVKVEGAEEAAAGPEAQPMVGERLDLEDAVDGYFDIPLRHAIPKKIKLEPGRGAEPPQLDKSGDIGGRGSGATGAGVPALELEYACDGYVDTALPTPPAPVKVEGAEEAAAGPEAQPMVGERLDLEVAVDGYFDIPLRENWIKPEAGLAPGPALPEAGLVPEPAQTKRPARATKCAHGRRRSSCKECGGASICAHGRERSRCKDSGGSSICAHGRRRSSCKECGGASKNKARLNQPQARPSS